MESCHLVSWQKALNNLRVPLGKTYTPPGFASASWQCVLKLPNCFKNDDDIIAEADAPTKAEADEHACRLAVFRLLTENPHTASAVGTLLRLRPPDWNLSIEELLKNMPHSLPAHQALPVHVNAKRARMDGEAAAERLSDPPDVWEGRVEELLREILTCHGGSFEPSNISHKKWAVLLKAHASTRSSTGC